jgi:hypothetical protein
MALSDAVRQPLDDQRKKCKIALFVDGLPDEEAKAFNEAVDLITQQRQMKGSTFNRGYTCSWLIKLVEAEIGLRLNLQSVQRHVVGDCVCGRPLWV